MNLQRTKIDAKPVYRKAKSRKTKHIGFEQKITLNPMMQPCNPNVISGIIAEAINQAIRRTLKDSAGNLSPKMRGILDETVKHSRTRAFPEGHRK